MKRILPLALIGTTLLSCQSETEQVKIAKAHIKTLGYSDTDISQYTFTQAEFLGKDVYNMINEKYKAKYKSANLVGDYKMMEASATIQIKNLITANTVNLLKFWKVQAVQMDGVDTLHHKIVYLDNKNNIVDDYNRK